MTTEQQAADESLSQAARLDQFLGWLLPTIVGFAALEGVAGLAFADAPTLGTTLILVAYAALIWLARSLARRARVGAAVVVACAGLLAASIGVVLLQPSLYPTLTIVPLLVVAVALPYVGGRRLIRLLVGCWLVTILVAVLGQTLTDQAAIPAWFAGLFYTSALATASAMVLLLLWQFSDRLSEALGRLEAQRERLHVTLHSIGDGVIATDTAGTVTLLNPIAEALTGWPRDEAVGRPFREVFPIISEVTRAPAVDPIATVLSTGARVGLANHTVLVARDGVERSIADSAAPIRDHGNRLHGVVVVFHDVTERQRAERDQRLLVAAGAALAGSLEAQVVAQRLTDLATPDLADLCIVDLLLEDGSIQRPAAAHRDPAQARFVVRGSTPRYPPRLDATVGVGKVLRTGESEFYPVVPVGMLDTLAQDAEHLQLLRRLGFASYLVAPLVARGRTLGALSCMRAEAGRHYTTADLALAEELARRAALAIDNAQLYTAERQARAEAEAAHQRLTILAEAGAALAASLDVEATLATITHLIVPRLADWAVVWWRAASPGETPALRPVAPVHRDPSRASLLDELHWHSLAADRFGGVGRVLGTGEPELVAAIDDDHLQRVAGDSDYLRVLRALGPRSHLMLPLAARGQVLGVLAMVQAELGRRYGPDDLALGRELAARAALALDNARLYQAEQAARRHLAVLAEAGAALTASLDFEATLARVARLVVPALADWCTVDLVEEDEPVGLRRLAAVHADPAKEALVARLVDYPPRPPAEHPVLTVVRTGQPTLGVDVPDGVIEAAARDAEHLALVRAIGMRSFMIVPLRVRERVLGAISLVAAELGRRYGPDDLALAEQLAERAALAIDNARLYREARAAVRIREEFLAVASHELRTPLTSVKGYVQLLDRQVRGDDGPLARLRGIIDPLHTQVRRLEMLVGDLLDVSRLQQGRLELRPELVELGELARQVVARFEHAPHRTPRHALVVAAPAPVTGTWDAARLDQVLTNLVGNALKFSPTGGEVRVVVRQEGGEALLTVSDEGLGIGPDERAALFQPFQRGEATARAIPGVGLGLYIASEIVARHGGRIEVASAVGEGSTFVVRLPLAD